jgi:FKBP-type peptidyl-prolyl cis-trans isomerase/parvulin-like peptidyl-prolyl isomerase
MKIARTVLALVLSLLLATGFIGCTQKEAENQVAATVNGTEILESDVTTRIESFRISQTTGETMDDTEWATLLVSANFTPETLREFVIREQFAIYILILQKAADLGITPDAEKIDQDIADIKTSIETSGSTWEEFLKSSGYSSETAYREEIEARSIAMDVVNAQIGDTTPTQAEIETYVSENAAAYAGKRFSLIYLPYDAPVEAGADTGDGTESDGTETPADSTATEETPTDTSATSAAAVLQTAEEALEKINGGTDFAAVAEEYSQSAETAQKGGDFGWGAESSMPDEVKTALDALGVGEISGIIDSTLTNAYFIVKCTEEFILPQTSEEANTEEATEDSTETSEEGTEGEQSTEPPADSTEPPADAADMTDATDIAGATTVEFSAVPASLVEMLTTTLTDSRKTEAQRNYLQELIDSDEIVINPLPEGLSYIVDMSLATTEEESAGEEESQGPESAPAPTFDENGLGISDIVVGTGPEAQVGDTVLVHYSGYFADGRRFDTSIDSGQPFEVIIGESNVIQGWHLGLVGMKVGGKRQIVIPPELAYGAEGTADGTIPPNSTLTFDIELLSVNGDATGSSGGSITPITPSEETGEGEGAEENG